MVIVKRHANDLAAYSSTAITAKAKGTMAYLVAAEGQHMTLERMESEMAEGVASLRRYIKELEESGHLKRIRKHEGQRVWYDWIVTL